MRTQTDTLITVKNHVKPTMTPAQAAQALAEKVGIQEARIAVEKVVLEVEHDVAEWDFWTDVRLWLLH